MTLLVALALEVFMAELGRAVIGAAADTIGAVRVLEDGVNADLAIVGPSSRQGLEWHRDRPVQIRHLSGIASMFLTGDA